MKIGDGELRVGGGGCGFGRRWITFPALGCCGARDVHVEGSRIVNDLGILASLSTIFLSKRKPRE